MKGNISSTNKTCDKMSLKVVTYIIHKGFVVHGISTVHYGTVKTLKSKIRSQ